MNKQPRKDFYNGQLYFFNLVAKAGAGSARILFIFPQLPGSYVSTQPGQKTHFQFLRM